MTEDEARIVGAIACSADGGCSHCVDPLIADLTNAFPEHADLFARLAAGDKIEWALS